MEHQAIKMHLRSQYIMHKKMELATLSLFYCKETRDETHGKIKDAD